MQNIDCTKFYITASVCWINHWPKIIQPIALQRNLLNGRTKNDHRYFNANHFIVDRLTNARIQIDIKLNSSSISIFPFINRLAIDFWVYILGHGCEWSTNPSKTSWVVVFLPRIRKNRCVCKIYSNILLKWAHHNSTEIKYNNVFVKVPRLSFNL